MCMYVGAGRVNMCMHRCGVCEYVCVFVCRCGAYEPVYRSGVCVCVCRSLVCVNGSRVCV